VVSVEDVLGRKHLVTEIVVNLSGPVNAAQADKVATYRLTTANGKGSFTARNSPVIRLSSAVFDPTNDTIMLTPRKAFALNKPVELTINGTPPAGLQDTSGQLIDGDGNGTPGGNAVALIRRTGVTLNPVAPAPPRVRHPARPVGIISHPAPAPPVGISTPTPAPPVGMGPITPAPPVGIGTIPPAPPVGIGTPAPPVGSPPPAFPIY
jgi:hypothetical protein